MFWKPWNPSLSAKVLICLQVFTCNGETNWPRSSPPKTPLIVNHSVAEVLLPFKTLKSAGYYQTYNAHGTSVPCVASDKDIVVVTGLDVGLCRLKSSVCLERKWSRGIADSESPLTTFLSRQIWMPTIRWAFRNWRRKTDAARGKKLFPSWDLCCCWQGWLPHSKWVLWILYLQLVIFPIQASKLPSKADCLLDEL